MSNKLAPVRECKFAKDGTIEGYAAVFNNVDLGMDRIVPGAFKKSLRKRNKIPMLWQHKADEPIGLWSELREDHHGLFVRGKISNTSGGRDALTLLRDDVVSGLSIGFIPRDFKFEGDVRVLLECELLETSIATFPMNPEARVAAVKTQRDGDLELAHALDELTREIRSHVDC